MSAAPFTPFAAVSAARGWTAITHLCSTCRRPCRLVALDRHGDGRCPTSAVRNRIDDLDEEDR